MDKASVHRTFSALIKNLHPMLKFIRKQLEKVNLDECCTAQVELAIEEALVNIIKHGFIGVVPGNIKIYCYTDPLDKIKILLTDNGISFNPLLNVRKKNSSSDVCGGYGIYLIMTIMDDVSYEYKDGRNHLSLIKFKPKN